MTLTLKNLAFERNNQVLFHSINRSLYAGDMLQIRGANGCGKSTLLRILAGYIEPLNGTVLWNKEAIFTQETYQQAFCYIGHQNGIRPYLTVYENLTLFCALIARKSSASLLLSTLQRTGLANVIDTQACYLSAGQKRRLALARLLINPVKLWLLDEPMTALDAQGQVLLNELLQAHLTEKGIVVIATHQELFVTEKTQSLELDGSYYV